MLGLPHRQTMRLLFTRVLLVFVFLATVAFKARSQDVLLGILEDVPGIYEGEANSAHVRAVFQKIGKEWEAFPAKCSNQACLKTLPSQYPPEVVWTIGFDGRTLGRVTARTPKDFRLYSHVGLQDLSPGPVPIVGKRSTDYGGFTFAPAYRPLIANSRPYFKDRESWKPAQLSNDVVVILRERFRKKFPTVSNCKNPDENVAKPWPYRDEDIKIGKAYSSNKSWSVAPIQLGEWRCDGPSDDAFSGQWFVVSPTKEITFLGAAMWLVDAGDYDDDGKTEVVFSIDDYNRGGDELFYDDFKKHAIFKFSYH